MTDHIDLPDDWSATGGVREWRSPHRQLAQIKAAWEGRLGDLLRAAHDVGIRANTGEMFFLETQIAVQRELLDVIVEFGDITKDASRAAQDAGLAVKARLSSIQAETDKLIQTSIDKYAKQIASEAGKWNIIREHKWNQRQNWTRVAVLTALVLGLVGTGFVARFALDEKAVLGVVDCMNAPLMVHGSSGSYLACPLSDLVPAATLNELNGEFFHSGP
jgi:hypothetical protein